MCHEFLPGLARTRHLAEAILALHLPSYRPGWLLAPYYTDSGHQHLLVKPDGSLHMQQCMACCFASTGEPLTLILSILECDTTELKCHATAPANCGPRLMLQCCALRYTRQIGYSRTNTFLCLPKVGATGAFVPCESTHSTSLYSTGQ